MVKIKYGLDLGKYKSLNLTRKEFCFKFNVKYSNLTALLNGQLYNEVRFVFPKEYLQEYNVDISIKQKLYLDLDKVKESYTLEEFCKRLNIRRYRLYKPFTKNHMLYNVIKDFLTEDKKSKVKNKNNYKINIELVLEDFDNISEFAKEYDIPRTMVYISFKEGHRFYKLFPDYCEQID